MEKSLLVTYLSEDLSLREIGRRTGKSLSSVRYWMNKYDLKPVARFIAWDAEEVKRVAKICSSKREMLTYLGHRDTGSIYKTLNRFAELHNIKLPDSNQAHGKGTSRSNPELLLQLGTDVKGFRLKTLMMNYLHIPYECKECGLVEWLGKPITLHVDHINGNHTDNRRENLRFLCPNCHSQTETYARQKKKKASVL